MLAFAVGAGRVLGTHHCSVSQHSHPIKHMQVGKILGGDTGQLTQMSQGNTPDSVMSHQI